MDEIGKLGFGFMRLPVVEGDGGKEIDIEQVKHMVDLFMDAGFTYFDTARGYHNGRSEAALREAVPGCHEAAGVAGEKRRSCARHVRQVAARDGGGLFRLLLAA